MVLMATIYFQYYLELAKYLIQTFSESNIVSLEFSITLANPSLDWDSTSNPYVCDFVADVIQDEKVFEWYQSPKELLQLYSFHPETLTYQIKSYSYNNFMASFFEQLPFLKDAEFLLWLRQWMPKQDSEQIAYLSMDRTNPDKDINIFLQPLKKILFFNQLSQHLQIDNEQPSLLSEDEFKKI